MTQKTLIFASTLACIAAAAPMHSLYTDHRAMRVDDILTVMIYESAKAGSESATSTSKTNGMGLKGVKGSGALGFLPSFGASASNNIDYDGKGGTSREGSLVARVSARVDKVLDNGNLVITGSKTVEINNEKEIIKISGVVRPQDIESDNIVYSHNVADAQITYSGKGNASNGRRPGLIARILNWIF
jgi:flagellar L-ring protein precursor FlgH